MNAKFIVGASLLASLVSGQAAAQTIGGTHCGTFSCAFLAGVGSATLATPVSSQSYSNTSTAPTGHLLGSNARTGVSWDVSFNAEKAPIINAVIAAAPTSITPSSSLATSVFDYKVVVGATDSAHLAEQVPLLITGTYRLEVDSSTYTPHNSSLTVADHGYALAKVSVWSGGKGAVVNSASPDIEQLKWSDCSAADHFSCYRSGTFTFLATASAGHVLNIEMLAEAQLLATSFASGTSGTPGAKVIVDPYISIAPNFADARYFSVITSAGVGNTMPVPEPGARTTLLIGLAALGCVRWWRYRI